MLMLLTNPSGLCAGKFCSTGTVERKGFGGGKMFQQALKVLLVHEDVGSPKEIYRLLNQTDLGEFEFEWVSSSLMKQNGLSHGVYDVCLIDSAGNGISLLTELRRVTSNLPIVLLTQDSASQVLAALHHGATDCLVRENLTSASLEESICAAIETARKAQCQAEYERCYLGLVENTAAVIYSHDLLGDYTSINQVGEQLTGYTRDELLSMNVQQIIAPEYIDLVWGLITRMLEDRKPTSYKALIVTKEARRIPVSIANHLIYRDGTPVGIQGVANELTGEILESVSVGRTRSASSD
jgi:PAS domain S-box-containing protein